VSQDRADRSLHLACDIHASRAAIDVAEGEAGIGDSRVVEDWYEARRVGHNRAIEQGLIPIGQADKINVSLKVVRLAVEVSQHALDLPVECIRRGRQKTFEPKALALVRSERRALVANGVVQQRNTMLDIKRLSLEVRYHCFLLYFSGWFQWGGFSGWDCQLLA
jgi:hypothetical protein